MQTAGDFVGFVVEFTAGVKRGHNDFEGRDFLFGVFFDRDASAVVGHGDGFIFADFDNNVVAEAAHGLVDGVVDYFVDHVVEAALAGVADIHRGSASDRLESFEDLDGGGVVAMAVGDIGNVLFGGLVFGAFCLLGLGYHCILDSFLATHESKLFNSRAVGTGPDFRHDSVGLHCNFLSPGVVGHGHVEHAIFIETDRF